MLFSQLKSLWRLVKHHPLYVKIHACLITAVNVYCIRPSRVLIGFLLLCCLFSFNNRIHAANYNNGKLLGGSCEYFTNAYVDQDSIKKDTSILYRQRLMPVKVFTLQMGFMFGFDGFKSSDIELLLGDGFGVTNMDVIGGLAARLNLRDIAQIEIRQLYSSHNIAEFGVPKGHVLKEKIAETNMKYRSKEALLKFNPIFPFLTSKKGDSKPHDAVYLVAGKSKITYLDKIGDGWTGHGNLYGLEYSRFNKRIGVSLSFIYNKVQFERIQLNDLVGEIQFQASHWVFAMGMTFGIGY